MKNIIKKKEKPTFEKVWALIQETDRILTEKFQETDRKFQETDRKMKDLNQDLSKEIKNLSKLYGGVSKNIGDAAEDFFYNGLSSTMKIGSIKYDIIERNVRRKMGGTEGEFDSILINSNTVVVVEVKYKIHPEQVEKMAQKKIPVFKELYPEYSGYKIYGAVAGFAIPPESLKLAQQNGLFVLTQKGDHIALMNDKGFYPVSF